MQTGSITSSRKKHPATVMSRCALGQERTVDLTEYLVVSSYHSRWLQKPASPEIQTYHKEIFYKLKTY